MTSDCRRQSGVVKLYVFYEDTENVNTGDKKTPPIASESNNHGRKETATVTPVAKYRPKNRYEKREY